MDTIKTFAKISYKSLKTNTLVSKSSVNNYLVSNKVNHLVEINIVKEKDETLN